MENKGVKKQNGDNIPESSSRGKSTRKSPQGRRSPSKEIPKVHLMSRAGSRTRKYEERRRASVPIPAPPPAQAPVTLNRHRAMSTQPPTHADQFTFPVHGRGQPAQPPPAPKVEAKGKTAMPLPANGASSSTNRANGAFGTNTSVEVCENCSCSFDPNASVNKSREAFLIGDKYCGACVLGLLRKG